MNYLELTENNIIELQRKQYKAEHELRMKELEKTIYNNACFIDKIKIRIRRFVERRLYKKSNYQSN